MRLGKPKAQVFGPNNESNVSTATDTDDHHRGTVESLFKLEKIRHPMGLLNPYHAHTHSHIRTYKGEIKKSALA